MVRLNRPQREALADTLRELANLADCGASAGTVRWSAAALVDADRSRVRRLARVGGIFARSDGRGSMINALLLLGLITVAAGVIVLLDWLGRKKDRETRGPIT
jgi:hypothetical protein